MQPIFGGLAQLILQPQALLALIVGTSIGVVVGLTPGVSSRSALLMAIPFVLSLNPVVAAILLISLHAASQISGTVPAALFGAPTSASEAATVVDGYPLVQRGEGSRVLGVIISASAIGGVAGAAALLLVGPVASHFLLAIGSPEIAALAATGILAIAAISSSGLATGIALGAAGILASTVGLDKMTGIARFTFGHEELSAGFAAPAVIAGLMAIPELLRIEPPRTVVKFATSYRAIIAGLVEPFRHGALLLRSSLIGLFVGVTPGIGSSVAAWLSYGQATKSVHPATPFGEGAIEGVIAPETASGSKEGGAFIPTLLLGIPGSSGMAIMLAAFALIGITVGPTMLSRHPEFPATVAWSVAFADLFGLVLCLAVAPLMIRLASLPRRQVAVVALTGAVLAAYYASPFSASILEVLAFAVIGVLLASAGLARPPFLIGFVIGPIFESALLRSTQIYGWVALARPGVLIIAAIAAAAVAFSLRGGQRDPTRSRRVGLSRFAVLPLLLLAATFVGALVVAHSYGGTGWIVPTVCAGLGFLCCALAARSAFLASGDKKMRFRIDFVLGALLAVGIVATPFLGPAALALPLFGLARPAVEHFFPSLRARWSEPKREGQKQ